MRRLAKVYLEITNHCNLECSFCPPLTRSAARWDLVQFRTVLGKLQGQVATLYFHLKGEPLSHPLLGSFLDLAQDMGFQVILTTNGTLLSQSLAVLQNKPALQRLNVSLHALAELPPAARGDRLAEILSSVQSLADPLKISLRFWDSGNSLADGYCAAGIETVFALPVGSLAAKLSAKNGAMLSPHISIHRAERFDWPNQSAAYQGDSGFCHGLRDQAGVLVDGTVVPCCLDADGTMNLGNIFEQDFQIILDAPRAKAFYAGFSQRRAVEALCQHCSFRGRF